MQPTRNLHSYSDTARRGQPRSVRIPLSIALLSAGFAAVHLGPASAQIATSPQQTTSVSPDAIRQREQELEATRAQQKGAAELQAKLKADIAAIGQDRSKLNAQLIDIAAEVRGVETRIDDAEARLHPLDSREQQIRGSLDSRRSEIVEVLAALQRAGRRTPPALLVRPEDALHSLRTAMLLGSVVPELRVRAEKLAGDLTELVTLRKTIATERDRLAADRDKLRDDQTRLAALVDERQRKQSAIEKDMEAEGARAIALSRQVDSLQGLIGKMEQDLKSAAKAAATATLRGAPATLLNGKPDLGALKDPARMSPAIAFASAKGLFAMPVNGSRIREFGGSDGAGGVEKGISLAARAGAQVTTPCDGWVVYAGPFRSYGQLLILNAGGGYHVLIAGMERISVNIGQFVLTGEPVATMGTRSQVASILATNARQPVLYVEFRKDGTPIDPGPWWAASEGEKVRG
jgi:septal ring factor EnvC (AmiA/AmiB activator)